jgi:hypothetical protein
VARVAAEWLGLIVVLRDEARLVAFDVALITFPAWHWLWRWWRCEWLVAVVAWFPGLLTLVARLLARRLWCWQWRERLVAMIARLLLLLALVAGLLA